MVFLFRYFTSFVTLLILLFPLHASAELHSPWDLKGANERIKENRMGKATLKFLKSDGKPINRQLFVEVKLKKHLFQFGIGMGQSWALFDQKNFKLYRNLMGDIFNVVALGFQWSWMEQKKGRIREVAHIESNLNWAKSRGVDLKGMPLVWHNAIPNWLRQITDPKEIEPLVVERIRYLINTYPHVNTWNLYNEAVGAEKDFIKNNMIANWLKSKGGAAAAQAWVSKIAIETAPDKVYVNNHYSHRDPDFKKMNHELLKMGARIDAIGIQTHMHTKQNRLNEQELWKLLEDYKVFGKPIHLTEISVPSSPPFENWTDFKPHVHALRTARPREKRKEIARKSEDYLELYQANYLKDFYTLAFSHPNVGSMIYWSGSDLYEWRGTAAGLLDRKFNPKPAYYVLKDLIKKQWHTEIVKATNLEGKYSFLGFYGEYSGKTTVNGIEQSFSFNHVPGQMNTHVVKLN